MTTNELNHLKGLAETAIHNANNAENKTNSTEADVIGLEEAMCDNYAEQAETNATVEEALIEIYELIEGGN